MFGLLYKFLSADAAEKWLDYHASRESHSLELFWEVHHTCVEIVAWCRTNQASLTDEAIERLEGANISKLKAWRDAIDDHQTMYG
jgi:hypothetical protein